MADPEVQITIGDDDDVDMQGDDAAIDEVPETSAPALEEEVGAGAGEDENAPKLSFAE